MGPPADPGPRTLPTGRIITPSESPGQKCVHTSAGLPHGLTGTADMMDNLPRPIRCSSSSLQRKPVYRARTHARSFQRVYTTTARYVARGCSRAYSAWKGVAWPRRIKKPCWRNRGRRWCHAMMDGRVVWEGFDRRYSPRSLSISVYPGRPALWR